MIHVIGAGLAGSEVAWQVARAGYPVTIHEMRPNKMTEAHKTGEPAELVCSNSFKSTDPCSAPGQLKSEMRALGSITMLCAEEAKVPAGKALAVDRVKFSALVSQHLRSLSQISLVNEEILALPSPAEHARANELWIVATGPLTGSSLAEDLQQLCGSVSRLYFYDAIAPIIESESIDHGCCFVADRYQEGGDYLNIPLSKEVYDQFVTDLLRAEKMPLHNFEESRYFEGCLPIEVMAERGTETLRFGPLKPVGFVDPTTRKRPHAVIQLRKENRDGSMYSMVGFQTKMTWPEQKRVFRKIPGLNNAEFYRYGSVHRNTYIESPKVLGEDFSFRNAPAIFLAGQITGVEGYSESAAIGILVGRAVICRMQGKRFQLPPATTMMGALARYVTQGPLGDYQPMNVNFGLLPPVPEAKGNKQLKRKLMIEKAKEALISFI